VADFDTLHVGDGIVGAGRAVKGDAEIAGAGLGLGQGKAADEKEEKWEQS